MSVVTLKQRLEGTMSQRLEAAWHQKNKNLQTSNKFPSMRRLKVPKNRLYKRDTQEFLNETLCCPMIQMLKRSKLKNLLRRVFRETLGYLKTNITSCFETVAKWDIVNCQCRIKGLFQDVKKYPERTYKIWWSKYSWVPRNRCVKVS